MFSYDLSFVHGATTMPMISGMRMLSAEHDEKGGIPHEMRHIRNAQLSSCIMMLSSASGTCAYLKKTGAILKEDATRQAVLNPRPSRIKKNY